MLLFSILGLFRISIYWSKDKDAIRWYFCRPWRRHTPKTPSVSRSLAPGPTSQAPRLGSSSASYLCNGKNMNYEEWLVITQRFISGWLSLSFTRKDIPYSMKPNSSLLRNKVLGTNRVFSPISLPIRLSFICRATPLSFVNILQMYYAIYLLCTTHEVSGKEIRYISVNGKLTEKVGA